MPGPQKNQSQPPAAGAVELLDEPAPGTDGAPTDALGRRLYNLRIVDPSPTDRAPFDHLTAGGQAFSRETNRLEPDPRFDAEEGRVRAVPRPGALTPLSDVELERVKAAVESKVVRWRNAADHRMGGAAITCPKGQRLATDTPLSRYVRIEAA